MSALPPTATAKADIGGWSGLNWGQSISALPVGSNVDLLRYGKGIINLDPKIPNSALYLGVTEQKLNGSQIPRAPIDQRRLSSPQ